MTKVKITKSIGGHKAGDTIDVPEATAERFIARGLAEKPKAAAKPAAKKAEGVGGDSPSPA